MSTTMTALGSGGVALLLLALVCWLVQTVLLCGLAGRETHGDAVVGVGLAWVASMVFAGFTWLWLGGLLLKSGVEDRMPAFANLPAAFLYIVAAGSVAAAYYLLTDSSRVWPAAVPVSLPPILILYVFALYQGQDWTRTALGLVLLLSLAPLPTFIQQLGREKEERTVRARERDEAKAIEGERNRPGNLEKLKIMTPDLPLTDWYPLLVEESGVRTEAFEALRHVERRQGDIEFLLSKSVPIAMRLLPDLDLKATPELCESARTYMLNRARSSRVRAKQDPVEYRKGGPAEDSLAGIRWLQAHGCNCDEGLAAIEASVQSHLDSPDRKAALAALAALREKHQPRPRFPEP